jgi:3-oxoadipate enol-lactonase
MWAPQVPVWSSRFWVVNVDLPGHGTSPPSETQYSLKDLADAVCAHLDARAIDRFAIVGLSLGGMVAQALAIHRPQRVWAAVLAHTLAAITPAARKLWDERIAAVEARGIESQVEATLERWFTQRFRTDAPLTMAWVADMVRATDARGFVTAARAIQSLDHLELLADVEVPALVVAGREDASATPSAAEAMHERLARSELTLLESAHLGNVEQSVAFTERVGAFLRQHSP